MQVPSRESLGRMESQDVLSVERFVVETVRNQDTFRVRQDTKGKFARHKSSLDQPAHRFGQVGRTGKAAIRRAVRESGRRESDWDL